MKVERFLEQGAEGRIMTLRAECEKLHSEEPQNLYQSLNII
jgi:hypothetical protein